MAAAVQDIVLFAAVCAVLVVFIVYFYYRGEEILDHVEDINPYIWTSNKLRLDVCNLPFTNLTGKCMDPDFCHYEERTNFKRNLLNCRIFSDFVCCPLNDNVLV